MHKLIHILWDANLGGIQKLILQLARQQYARAELKVEVVFLKNTGSLLDEFKAVGFKVHQLDIHSGFDIRPGQYVKLKSILRDKDLIHVHSFNPWVAMVVAGAGKKIIYTEHGNFGFGRRRRFTEHISERLQGVFLRKYPSLITFNSNFSKEIAEVRYRTKNRPSLVLHNGVDIKSIRDNAKRGLQAEKHGFVIGTTTRLAGGKRVSLLIDLMGHLHGELEDTNLWIVGDGPERRELEARAKSLGLSEKVRFWGSRQNPARFQKAMDICVYPFKNEAFGLVAIESMALGKPAIVMEDGGGLTEIIRQVSPRDICRDETELKERIKDYHHHREKLNESANMFRQYAEQFDIRIMEEKLFTTYMQIV